MTFDLPLLPLRLLLPLLFGGVLVAAVRVAGPEPVEASAPRGGEEPAEARPTEPGEGVP